jgi:hypothetical protein
MTHTKDKAKAATPHHDLIAELLNPNIPKNEREHAAVREIERLQALAAPTLQEGWKFVPVVATREIEDAIGKARNLKASEIWEDALAATPPAAPAQPAPVHPVALHRDLHSHLMVVAHRAVDLASSNGQKAVSQKEIVRAICKAIQTDKNLLAKLTPPAAPVQDYKNRAAAIPARGKA